MEYVYVVSDTNLTIHTPGVESMSLCKNEFIEQTAELTIRKCTFPNGFEILFKQTPEMVVLTTNRPLQKNDDGSYTAPTADT